MAFFVSFWHTYGIFLVFLPFVCHFFAIFYNKIFWNFLLVFGILMAFLPFCPLFAILPHYIPFFAILPHYLQSCPIIHHFLSFVCHVLPFSHIICNFLIFCHFFTYFAIFGNFSRNSIQIYLVFSWYDYNLPKCLSILSRNLIILKYK